ncbi:hypothetical protein D3C87_1347870 [compost metagenome]
MALSIRLRMISCTWFSSANVKRFSSAMTLIAIDFLSVSGRYTRTRSFTSCDRLKLEGNAAAPSIWLLAQCSRLFKVLWMVSMLFRLSFSSILRSSKVSRFMSFNEKMLSKLLKGLRRSCAIIENSLFLIVFVSSSVAMVSFNVRVRSFNIFTLSLSFKVRPCTSFSSRSFWVVMSRIFCFLMVLKRSPRAKESSNSSIVVPAGTI